jgi:hypothetical protein
MQKRIIKDIRYYELKPEGYSGRFDGTLGNVYKGSFEITCIGQRIARKLNELKFITGDFDHLYIYLSPKLDHGTIVERDFEYDKHIKCFDFGQRVDDFNDLTDAAREKRIHEITFKVLKWKYGPNKTDEKLIDSVENMIETEGRKIIINYKHKETKDYKLNVGFQIAPADNKSKIVIDYSATKINSQLRATIDLDHYEDIYYLIDKVFVERQQIILKPKRSLKSELVTNRYATPLTIGLDKFDIIEP